MAEELGDFSNPPYGASTDAPPPAAPEKITPAAIEGFDPATSVLLEQTEIEDIYQNADGSVSVQRHGDAVRVEQSDGSFKDADPTLTEASSADLPPAAEDVAGVADLDAFVKSEEHPLAPVVGEQADSGMVSLADEGASVRITPVDAPADSTAQQVSDTEVSFPGASEGSDVIYEFTAGTVKESITVTEAPGETGATSWSFWLDIEGASPVLTDDGAIELRKDDGAVAMMLPVPYSFDSSGIEDQQEPRDTNGSYTLTQDGSRWVLSVHMDRTWMNDPSLVYPVTVDPTVMPSYFNDARSVKSDGTVVMGSPVRLGNPNEPSGAKWRGLVHWDYSKYFNKGYQLVNAEVELARTGGTANAFGASMWTANGYGFANAGTNMAYAPWFGDSADLIGSPLGPV